MINNFNKKSRRGAFTLIEVLVSLFVLSIVMIGIYQLIMYSLAITSDNQHYVEAIAIANQKMEQIRNMPYDDVGTIFGSPHGDIDDYETIIRNGSYTIHTVIQFFDDPYDGTLDLGTDDVFTDYKRVAINVSWNTRMGAKSIDVFSRVIPPTEENLSGYGLLKLFVVDSNGVPVSGATVHVENSEITPPISVDYISDQSGKISVPVLPAFQSYKILVSKSGYSSDETYNISESNPSPIKKNLSVIENRKTEDSFSIDLISHLNIRVVSAELPNNFKVNSGGNTNAQTNSSIVSDSNGGLYVVWGSVSTTLGVYIQKYNELGEKQYSSDISISSDIYGEPDISISKNDDIYVSWCSGSSDYDCYFNKTNKDNGSKLWVGDKKIQDLNNSNQLNLKIFSSPTSTDFFGVWQDNADGDYDIYLQKFDESGNSIWSNPIQVNSNNETSSSSEQYDPSIFVDNSNNIYIEWTDTRNSISSIYIQKIDKDGSRLFTNDVVVNTQSSDNSYSGDICLDDNNNIYVTWIYDSGSNKRVFIQKFNDVGVKQTGGDVYVNTEGIIASRYSPSIIYDNNANVYVSWSDDRNTNKDIYVQNFSSSLEKYWSNELRTNVNIGTSPQDNSSMCVSKTSGKIFASWDDDRNGNFDIYLGEVKEYGTITNLNAIPIKLISSAKIGRDPDVYKYNDIYSSNSEGMINLNLPWDDEYSLYVDSSSPYHLIMSEPSENIGLDVGQTKNIILYLNR